MTAGEHGVAVTGDGIGIIATGDANTLQQDGIRTGRIDADNVVERVQLQDSDAPGHWD